MDSSQDKKPPSVKTQLKELKEDYMELSKKLQSDVREPLSQLRQLILEELDKLAV